LRRTLRQLEGKGAESQPFWDYVPYVPLVLAASVTIALAIVIGRQVRRRMGTRSKVSEGCHRIGVVIGGLFASLFVLGAPFWASSLSLFIYGELMGIVLFLVPYGILRLLGWIVDGFVTGGKRHA
jgi:hypothetical protein